jgi:UDP-glucose 4-epimerase
VADPPVLVSNCARARERLGWSPRHLDLAEQIADARAWHQNGRFTYERFQAERAQRAKPGSDV